jgi:dCMP deaminase
VTDDERTSRHHLYVGIALEYSRRSTCTRGQVGAVLVRDNRILSAGYNGAPSGQAHCTEVGCWLPDGEFGGCKRAIHAEANALVWAARVGIPIDRSTLYATHATCNACSRLLVAAGIAEVVFLNDYRRRDIDTMLDAGIEVGQYDGPRDEVDWF